MNAFGHEDEMASARVAQMPALICGRSRRGDQHLHNKAVLRPLTFCHSDEKAQPKRDITSVSRYERLISQHDHPTHEEVITAAHRQATHQHLHK